MPDLYLKPISLPTDAPVPTTLASLAAAIGEIIEVLGGEGLQGVQIGQTAPDDRTLAWIKLSEDGSPDGLWVFAGTWTRVNITAPITTSVTSPKSGTIAAGPTSIGGLLIYNGASFTSQLIPAGNTASRPTSPAVGYRYRDTDISCDLVYTSSGWSTVAGSVGDTKMVTGLTVEQALTKNPGWVKYTGLEGCFPLGFKEGDYPLGATGGRDSFDISGIGCAAQGGNREQKLVSAITIDGTLITGVPGSPSLPDSEAEVSVLNPYVAVLWLRKEF